MSHLSLFVFLLFTIVNHSYSSDLVKKDHPPNQYGHVVPRVDRSDYECEITCSMPIIPYAVSCKWCCPKSRQCNGNCLNQVPWCRGLCLK